MNANDWTEAALAKYIVTNPTLPEEQKQQTLWAFEDEAENLGIPTWDLALQFISETPEQLKELRLAAHKEAADALDMEWDEYCELNEVEQ
jgi:hypothetical protein